MKSIFLILLSIIFLCAMPNGFIDPTGRYKLVSDVKQVGEDQYGYSGEILVKLIKGNRIVVDFNVNAGAPRYHSGGFFDTLVYSNNEAIYKSDFDSTCILTLQFSKDGVLSTEQTADYNGGCGFGQGIVANGFFKKISSEIPIEIDSLSRIIQE